MKSRWKIAGKVFGVIVIAYTAVAIPYNLFFLPDAPKTSQVQAVKQPEINEPEVSDFDPALLLAGTNDHRIKNGLTPVTINQKLNLSASTKCNDMVARNYWEHDTPDGQKPWAFITATGYKYAEAGENLLYGVTKQDAKYAVEQWIKSPSHNENLLNPKHLEVGFGICKSTHYIGAGGFGANSPAVIIVQHFARPYGQ